GDWSSDVCSSDLGPGARRAWRHLRQTLQLGTFSFVSNIREDRHVEGDWWPEPIPPNVEFGEGFYCETAQIFRKLRSKKPHAVIIGKHVSCYAGCSFAIGENGHCTIGDFTLLNGALI